MSAFTLLDSKRQNKYFYDQKAKNTQWCHPLLYYILKLHDRGMDVEQWYRNLNNGPVKIEGFGTSSKKEIAYYFRKYILLRDNGFFSGKISF